jgi:hypothetical protein
MDAVRIIVISSHLDTAEILVSKETILNVFQRALNTWADAPPELFTFCDQLEKL